MVKKSSLPSSVLTILKVVPCQMCIYWFSNMDFQFCQTKFGALPILQDYPWSLVQIFWLKIGQHFEPGVWARFGSWSLDELLKPTCDMTWKNLFWWKHATLGSAVPLAMFRRNLYKTDQTEKNIIYTFSDDDQMWQKITGCTSSSSRIYQMNP